MKVLGYTFATIITLVLSGLIHAFVGYKLYNWFAVPVGAPLLGMGPLYGVIYFAKTMLQSWKGDKDAKDKEYSQILTEGFFTPVVVGGFALLFGYILKGLIY